MTYYEEPTNEDRADWALTALETFGDLTDQRKRGEWDDALESVIGDLITNLLHLARREGIDPDHVISNGRGNFEYEEDEAREELEEGKEEARERLEELREVLRSESMSYGELVELQGLAPYIDRGDVELLEAAGVPESEVTQ